MNKYTKWGFMSVLWLANPIYFTGCFTEKAEFTFGEEDMLALLDEVNAETWVYEGSDQTFEMRFTLERQEAETASLILNNILASAHACETRSFFAEASACIDVSELLVEGVVTILDYETKEVVQEEIAVTGNLDVYGYNLDNGSMYLSHDGGTFSFEDNPETEEVDLELDSAEW